MSVEYELQRSEELLRAGHKTQAQTRLARLLKKDVRNAQAWWLLANAQDDPQRKLDCLKRLLAFHPDHAEARALLDALRTPAAQPAPSAAQPGPDSAVPATAEAPEAPIDPPAAEADAAAEAPPAEASFFSTAELDPARAPAVADAAAEAPPAEASFFSTGELDPARAPAVADAAVEAPPAEASFFSTGELDPARAPAVADAAVEASPAVELVEAVQAPPAADTPAPDYTYRYRDQDAPPPAVTISADPEEVRQTLERGVSLVEAGQREEGRALLEAVTAADPRNEPAWLWLAVLTREPEMRRGYVEKVLAINPASPQARKLARELGLTPPPVIGGARAPGQPIPWYAVWWTALTRPTTATYDALLADPDTSLSRGVIWLGVVGLIIGAVVALAQALVLGPVMQLLADQVGLRTLSAPALLAAGLLCGVPAGAFGLVVGTLLNAGLTHLGAQLGGGRRPFAEQFFLTAAFTAPLLLVTTVLGAIPFLNLLVLPLSVYGFVLNIIAAKAVNRFGWGPALLAGLMPTLAAIALGALAMVALGLVLGPAVGNLLGAPGVLPPP